MEMHRKKQRCHVTCGLTVAICVLQCPLDLNSLSHTGQNHAHLSAAVVRKRLIGIGFVLLDAVRGVPEQLLGFGCSATGREVLELFEGTALWRPTCCTLRRIALRCDYRSVLTTVAMPPRGRRALPSLPAF